MGKIIIRTLVQNISVMWGILVMNGMRQSLLFLF